MIDAANIAQKLEGPAKAKQRREELLAELCHAFADGGPQMVTDEMTRRMDKLAGSFAEQLQELKKQV
jgi:hypothetical protein